jgi:hypothetical protein
MDKPKKSPRAGKFTIAPGKDIDGELTISRAKTSLYLHDKDFFDTRSIPDQYIKGVLHDLTRISLIRCITMSTSSSARGQDSYHSSTLFPHFVVSGDNHLAPDQKTIVEVHFSVDDASTLFYDFDAFGSLIDARPFIETIVSAKANALQRKIAIGANPEILYFTGKGEIFAVDTVLGRVSATHNPTHNLGGPNGVYLKNTIFLTIAFKEPVIFDEAIVGTSALLRYFGMLVGRPQNVLKLNLRTESDQQTPAFLRVHWSLPPDRETSSEAEKTHPSDVLMDAARQPEEFSRVLANWLAREHSWCDARMRFFSLFAKQNYYDLDRLIGAANMFDILPASAVPPNVQLSDELKATKEIGSSAFCRLPPSPERDSVLSALGRIGKASLKHKVRHRAQLIVDAVPERFPELLWVTDEAVNCRNYYVHGGERRRFGYDGNFNVEVFLAETLEFVFAASDLIEAGWDVRAWANKGTTMYHRFARFRIGYATRLQELKAVLRR